MASSISLNKLMAASNFDGRSHLSPVIHLAADPISFMRSIGEDDSSDSENDLLTRFGRDVSLSDVIPNLKSTSSRRRSLLTTRETGEALHIRLEMPGLSKEEVTVTVTENKLVIKGEAKKGPDEEVQFVSGKFEREIVLSEKVFKIKELKAKMENGVLTLVVPKVKKDVAQADAVKINVD